MNDIRVLMIPHLKWFRREESGIKRVVEGLFASLPQFSVKLVDEGQHYDLVHGHAGMEPQADVATSHGLYWTADYSADAWEWAANRDVTEALRNAREIIVPSEWVAETIRRDMHRRPHVIGHGIDWEAFANHNYADNHFVLWNKNRAADVCDPQPVVELAKRFPNVRFLTTFAPRDCSETNVQVLGIRPHEQMTKLVQSCTMYLSTTKETFGIGTLEAMAAGVPVLGFAHGGNLDLVRHGVNGYLAQPGNYDDLADGLRYCSIHRATLGANGREMAKEWTWAKCAEKTAAVYRLALVNEPPLVTVVIPCYNYADRVGRAIESVLGQTHELLELYVVDDGSSDDVESVVRRYREADSRVHFIRQKNQGVANARNNGIAAGTGKYVSCLDADDAMAREFLAVCVEALEKDRSLQLAYTGLWSIQPDGSQGNSPWPHRWDFDAQLRRQNQVPTCCVYRREAWECLGGYRQRYAPEGAGAEDGELWYRFGAYGFRCAQVTEAPYFVYSQGTGRVSGNPNYREPDWLAFHPEARDGLHPFASFARPARFSHPVRQYDRPVVSVVIPVGPGHEREVLNALDSLEAQTFRQWEAVVVWDAGGEAPEWLRKACPFARYTTTEEGRRGAGYARNRGRELARAPLLLFLDADDWLYPQAIERMLEEWQASNAVVYSDYVGKAFVDDVGKLDPTLQKRVRHYDERTHEAVIEYHAADYDCERALRQPEEERPYLWCNVTALLPAAWFDEVGGFDEAMPSWEDVDLWWRIARKGHCFSRLAEPLLVYRFYTGSRRDEYAADGPEAAAKRKALFTYIRKKYEQEEPMPCPGCGKRRSASVYEPAAPREARQETTMRDGDFVLCRYLHPNIGEHPVFGNAPFDRPLPPPVQMIQRGGKYFINYGYRAGGGQDKFLVHRADVEAAPHLFQAVEVAQVIQLKTQPPPPPPAPPAIAQRPPEPAPPPAEEARPPDLAPDLAAPDVAQGLQEKHHDPVFELQKLAGMNEDIAAWLHKERGVDLPQDILDLGREALDAVPGMSKRRAGMIWNAAGRAVKGEPAAD